MTAMMTETIQLQNPGIKVRKIMGRAYLHEDRLKDAVEIFLGILRDMPDDVDTLLELGNLYLASGDGRTAVSLFRKVLQLAPERTMIRKQIELASLEEEESDLREEPVPTSPDAIARMLQRLTGETEPIPDDEIQRAYEMLQEILLSSRPGEEVARRLDDITNLLPALLEINIRQARADGKPQVAGALQNLQINIALQKNKREDAGVSPALKRGRSMSGRRHFRGTVSLLLPDTSQVSKRMGFAINALRRGGCKVSVTEELSLEPADRPDIIITSNPYQNADLVDHLMECRARGIPVIVDQDIDFEQLPVFHPDYTTKGPGHLANNRSYTDSFRLADLITTPSLAFADSLGSAASRVEYVPEGWCRENVPPPTSPEGRSEILLGWVGTSKMIEDLAIIRRVIIRVLNEFEQVKIVVIGNQAAYQLLDSIPPERKIFLPDANQADITAGISQLDILLLPLRAHPFNNTQSDRLLMEAGTQAIPWIGSPNPAFLDWKSGGLIANTRDEWHTYLRQLIIDPNLRKSFGKAGFEAASRRELKYSGHFWIEAIERVLRGETAEIAQ